jgi:hypothetical protein
MNEQTIEVTRQRLYDQVWSKPLRQLTKEYGMSDVGLSKLCRRHNIPLPSAGYWMKVVHGYTPHNPPSSLTANPDVPSAHSSGQIISLQEVCMTARG